MKLKKTLLTSACLSVLAAPLLLATPMLAAQAEEKTQKPATNAPAGSPEVSSQAEEKNKTLITEAVSALEETQSALAFLEQGKKKEALEAMARATGKLEIILARDPNIALAPVDVRIRQVDFIGPATEIRKIVNEARQALLDRKIQQARQALQPLASEINIDVLNIPLATYPAALKEAARLLEQDKTAEAKQLLLGALNTLVVQTTVIPIPFIQAEAALKEAEKLTEKATRSEEEKKRLAELLKLAAESIQRAELFGYGEKKDRETFLTQIKELENKTRGGQSGSGWFDGIKETLGRLVKSSTPPTSQTEVRP